MGLRIILLLSFFINFPALAQVVGVDGVSKNINQNPITDAWGVFVGEYDLAQTSGSYNNCGIVPSGVTFEGCHEKRVNGDTPITVRFNYTGIDGSTGLFPIAALVRSSVSGGSANILIERNNNAVNIGDGEASVTFTWRSLCLLLVDRDDVLATFTESTQTCTQNGQVQVSFGIGTNENNVDNTTSVTFTIYNPSIAGGTIALNQCDETPSASTFGFCDIAAKPGDSGGFLESTEGVENANTVITQTFSVDTPSGTASDVTPSINIDVEAVRLFVSTTYLDAQPWVESVKAFDVTVSSFNGDTAVFEDSSFGKLENDTPYFIRASTLDSSGTISQLFDDSFAGVHQITPSEVAGLIRENECFITTATYGSDQAYQVHLFRKFRKMFLYGNSFGHKVILLYNTYGPVGAEWIRQNPSSKKFMRALLYPFYGFAYLSVQYGLFVSFSFFALLLFLAFSLLRFKKEGGK